jgi:hypothetical protein
MFAFGTNGPVQRSVNWAANQVRSFLGIKKEEGPAAVDLKTVSKAEVEAQKERHKAEETQAEKIRKLKDELFREQQKTDLDRLSTEEKITELTRRRAEILATMSDRHQSEEGRLNAAMDIEKLDQELLTLNRPKKAPAEKDVRAPSVNELQRIGAFSSPVDSALLTTAQKSERHLARLVELTGYGSGINSVMNSQEF